MQTTILIDGWDFAKGSDSKLSRSDRAAVDRAIRQKVGQVVVCAPSGNQNSIRYALAAGATRQVDFSQIETGLIVCGLGGLGFENELTAARLTMRHGAQLVLEVLDFTTQEKELTVIRKLERGEKEVLRIQLPAVLVMSDSATASDYVSRYRQQRITISPIDSDPKASEQRGSVSQTVAWENVRRRTKTADLENKTSGGAHERMFSTFGIANLSTESPASNEVILTDPEDCALHLIRYLAFHQFLESTWTDTGMASLSPLTADSLKPDSERSSQSKPEKERFSVDVSNKKLTSDQHTRVAPRPVASSINEFANMRSRQPRPYRHSGSHAEMIDPAILNRYRRRPRSLLQSEPSHFRGPFPIIGN